MTQREIPYRLSAEGERIQRSVMRELLKQAAAPEVISLAGGLPDSALLPHVAYRECLDQVLTDERGAALQYRPQYAPLQAWLADYMQQQGVACDEEQIFITNGNQQGLTILSRLFLDAGDAAVTEAITFTGVQQVTAGRGAHVHPVPVDLATGADVDTLAQIFAEHRPKMAVIIPTFHNPLGVTLTQVKREQIAALAGAHGVPVVEDDPYYALRFDGTPQKPIKAYDEHGYVIYLGSFSKMLAPGLRLGWMVAPKALLPRLTPLRESIDLESSALTQRAVSLFLSRGWLDAHLTQLNAANRARCVAMRHALNAHLGDVATYTQPEGGLFVWVTLPPHINTWELLPQAIQAGVAFVPGGAFAVAGGYENTMRLNFSAVQPAAIEEGVRRLAHLINQQ